MSNLSKLPRVSDTFLNHIEGRTLEKNEWTPCPRCGGETVEPPSGALVGGIAGFGLVGCWIWIVAIGTLIMAFIFWPVAVVFAVIGLALIPLLPIIGTGMGLVYRCKSCSYAWTFKDIEQYKKSKPF